MKNQTGHIYEVGNVLHQDIDQIEYLFLIRGRDTPHTRPEQVPIFPWPRDAA